MMTMDEKLEQAYQLMAIIVRDHGEKYLSIFKRLHDEREQRKANQDLKQLALQMVQNRIN